MLRLDHLTVIAPTLKEGCAHLRDCLGVDIADGAEHVEMGTHNCRLRLSEKTYLEVIAVNPEAPVPAVPRWFGLSDAKAVRGHWDRGERLRSWVARSDDFDKVLAAHGDEFGETLKLGETARFSLRPDGKLPGDGLLPCVIDRGGQLPPSAQMPDTGARLRDFVLEHPSPSKIQALFHEIGIQDAPLVERGPRVRYFARIETRNGLKTLF